MAPSPFIAPPSAVSRKTADVLTDFEQRFVLEYLIDLNATAAYIRAGGSPVNARVHAAKLTKSGTRAYIAIETAKAERAQRTQINADNVLRELARIVLADPRALFNPDGSLKKPHEYSRDDAAVLDGVKTRRIVELDENGNMQQVEIQEVKLTPKLPAVQTAMKHMGLLNEKVDLTITAVGQRLEEAFRRTGRMQPSEDGSVIDVDPLEIDDEGGHDAGGDAAVPVSAAHPAEHGGETLNGSLSLDVEAMLR